PAMALFAVLPRRPLSLVRESPALYRPRRPERSTFYRLHEEHFAEFALVHEETSPKFLPQIREK
ncbi:MAG: hypothetical protein ABFS86_05740, partial [Planctomycetota bacterium]